MKGFIVSTIVVFGLVATAVSRGSEQSPPAPRGERFMITNVRLFDGERVRPNMQVSVDDGIIRAVGPKLVVGGGILTVDGSGSTLLPGLIDAHVHSRSVDDLQQAVRFGVTTVLDMALMDSVLERALREAAATRRDVADLRSAGILATSPRGHGTQYGIAIPTISSADNADAFVAARKRDGSDYLKIVLNGVRTAATGMTNLDEARVSALVRAAHSRGMLVVAHAETVADVRIAVSSGVDGLAHVWRESAPLSDVAAQVVRRGMFVVPTIAVFDGFVAGSGAALAADPRLAPFVSDAERTRLLRPPTPTLPIDVESRLSTVRVLRMAGAKLLAGTDGGSVTPTLHGLSLHRELELLVKAGLRPNEALTAATATAADAFRLTDRGRILAGRRADLVMVRGDPTTDITATRDIVRVWRSGVEFDRRLVR
jgi:imidazolonepropionase-like amidohydrolase